MPKTITQLANKFAKILVIAEPTAEEMQEISKDIERVFVPNEVKNALSALVDMLRGRSIPIDGIAMAWKHMMVDGQESPDGKGVDVSKSQAHGMLEALTTVWKALEGVGTEADIQKVNDVYTQFSQLKDRAIPQHPIASGDNSVLPWNADVLEAQQKLNKPVDKGGFDYAHVNATNRLQEDGKIGKFTRAALKWYRDHTGLEADDMGTVAAILAHKRTEVAEESVVPPMPKEYDPAPSTWGNSKTSRLAKQFTKFLKAGA